MPPTTPRKVPGVYVTELDAFPPSIVGVQTAVPAFIGYTERAALNGKSMLNTPVKITSMADYVAIFGGGYHAEFNINSGTSTNYDVVIGGNYDLLEQIDKTKYYLYNSLRLFFDNGGGTCYIVSVGFYSDEAPKLSEMEAGLTAIKDQVGPTILLAPDALLLSATEFPTFNKKMLNQCQTLKDRMAILDIYGIDSIDYSTDPNAQLIKLIETFRGQVNESLSYGAVYAPALGTSVVPVGDLNYGNFNIGNDTQRDLLKSQLKQESANVYKDNPARKDQVDKLIDSISATYDATLNKDLTAALPVLQQSYTFMAQKLGQLPPSGGMAGVYTYIDQTRGVWNAPANLSMTSVIHPMVKITADQQGDMNVPVDGKSVCAIREFVGKGTVVWGARTLDGNSNDWRYIQVRRAIIYIEQSIKSALDRFVFAPNDGKTWVAVVSMISNFLQGVWNQGGLMGATAQEAFTVQCGLGTTMTAQDILEGYMVVQVTLTMLRPAEFIELTFKQQMLGS
ncbi:MAG: phage tail sheath family protein [Polyangiaceae bacterium]|nr:phage tail sheath family protein [Polyangiaceae bacterium]